MEAAVERGGEDGVAAVAAEAPGATGADPFGFELFRNAIFAIADEMALHRLPHHLFRRAARHVTWTTVVRQLSTAFFTSDALIRRAQTWTSPPRSPTQTAA